MGSIIDKLFHRPPPLMEATRLLDDLNVAARVVATPDWDASALHRSIRYLEMDTHTVGRWLAEQPRQASEGVKLVNAGRDIAQASRWLDNSIRSSTWSSLGDIGASDRAGFDRLLRQPIEDARHATRLARDAMAPMAAAH